MSHRLIGTDNRDLNKEIVKGFPTCFVGEIYDLDFKLDKIVKENKKNGM